jgi:hypothetical protein
MFLKSYKAMHKKMKVYTTFRCIQLTVNYGSIVWRRKLKNRTSIVYRWYIFQYVVSYAKKDRKKIVIRYSIMVYSTSIVWRSKLKNRTSIVYCWYFFQYVVSYAKKDRKKIVIRYSIMVYSTTVIYGEYPTQKWKEQNMYEGTGKYIILIRSIMRYFP